MKEALTTLLQRKIHFEFPTATYRRISGTESVCGLGPGAAHIVPDLTPKGDEKISLRLPLGEVREELEIRNQLLETG